MKTNPKITMFRRTKELLENLIDAMDKIPGDTEEETRQLLNVMSEEEIRVLSQNAFKAQSKLGPYLAAAMNQLKTDVMIGVMVQGEAGLKILQEDRDAALREMSDIAELAKIRIDIAEKH